MATTRTVHTETAGPAHIRTDLGTVALTVIAERARRYAELTIATADDEGTSADAVKAATLTASGTTLDARIAGGGGSTTVIQTGRGFQSVNFGGGVIITGGGTVTVNGRVIDAGSGATVIAGGSPITVTARVPADSTVTARSVSGGIMAQGYLGEVRANSTSGDVDIESAATVRAQTVSGDITVNDLAGTATLSSVSGDVEVRGGPGTRASASTVSGDIRSSGGVVVDGSSVSGRVRNR